MLAETALLLPANNSATPVAAGLVCLGEQTATTEGLLAYNRATTPAWLIPILQAQDDRRIGRAAEAQRVTDQELTTFITAQFGKAVINLGHDKAAMDPAKLSLQVRAVIELLRQRWHYLTCAEIEQVFRLGSLAQLLPPPDRDGRPTEEVIYLSPKTVGVWLQRYKYQVKPQAMEHAWRVEPPRSELPHHHPVYAAWRIWRIAELAALPPAALRQLRPREGDFKSLLYHWLKEVGVLGFRPKPPGFWERLEALEKRRLCRVGEMPPAERLLQLATGQREKYNDRLDAAKRWRTLCLWLVVHVQRGTDFAALLWPLASKLYVPPVTA